MTTCPRCGKTNAAEIHTCTPKALVLAEWIERNAMAPQDQDAAAELRRLYEETEGQADRIRDIYKQLDDTEKEVDDCRLLLRQALDALEYHTAIKHPSQIPYRDRTIAALRRHLEPHYTATANEGSEP